MGADSLFKQQLQNYMILMPTILTFQTVIASNTSMYIYISLLVKKNVSVIKKGNSK